MNDRSTSVSAQGRGHALRTLLVQPDSGRGPIEALLEQARSSMVIKIFSFTDEALLAGVLDACRRGVRLRVILNGVRRDGTRDNDDTFRRLEEAGATVKWSQESFTASHEKSLVVDGEVAMLSSFNWCDKYFHETRDYGVITRDPAEVGEILACFEADWAEEAFTPSATSSLLWAPGIARRQVAALVEQARETIHLQHAILADATVLLRLTEAAGRGVRVRFLCAGGHGLHTWDRPETFASLRILQNSGGRIRKTRTPKMHGNLTLVDGRVAQLGSLHFQPRAFDTRRDLSIELRDHDLVHTLARRFDEDWAAAERYRPHDPIDHGDTDPVDTDVWRT